MAKMYLFAYNPGSNGADELAKALDIKKIKHENSKFKGNNKKVVINWGSSEISNPEIHKCTILNPPDKVKIASNKLAFFKDVSGKDGVVVPDWTTDPKTAIDWVTKGSIVCARTILNSHSANGLVLMKKDDPKSLVDAPLYTRYVPKKDEFRVHVIKGKVVDVQRKALRNGWLEEHGGEINYRVRNLANGFIYMRQNIVVPKKVEAQALAVMKVIGLDFGAVDVIYNEKNDIAYTLEVNSAPGLEGTTIDNYVKGLS
ncbi:MAG TPA: hypothetical protein PLS50_00065 [Candidatus Dojkabacteria bacterium]|nr:hypothetical protein [Candidatus Dojkabacteria bacterium]